MHAAASASTPASERAHLIIQSMLRPEGVAGLRSSLSSLSDLLWAALEAEPHQKVVVLALPGKFLGCCCCYFEVLHPEGAAGLRSSLSSLSDLLWAALEAEPHQKVVVLALPG